MGRVPWVAIDAGIRTSPKLAALPSDSARLGWLYIGLGEAKLQRPAGRFASRAHWAEVAGRFARYLPSYLAVGLLEEAPELCDRCRAAWGELPAGTLVVHDWQRHQRDPTGAVRVAALRDRRSSNGDVTPETRQRNAVRNGDVTAERRRGNGAVTPDSRARGMTETETETYVSTELERADSSLGGAARANGAVHDDDPLLGVRGWLSQRRADIDPGGRPAIELARLVDRHGAEAVIAAMASLPGPLTDGRQFVYGAAKALAPIPDVRRPVKGFQRSADEVAAAFARDAEELDRAITR